MFCKKCGAEIEENSKFCSVCGCEINAEKKVEGDGKILLVAGPQGKWCLTMVIGGGLMLLITVGVFFSAFGTEINAYSHAKVVDERNSTMIMSLFMFVVAISSIYDGMKWASMKITICENAVYGSLGVGISNQFKHTYDEILDVSGANNFVNSIVIVTKAKSYTLVHMNHAEDAVRMIHDRIKQQ